MSVLTVSSQSYQLATLESVQSHSPVDAPSYIQPKIKSFDTDSSCHGHRIDL